MCMFYHRRFVGVIYFKRHTYPSDIALMIADTIYMWKCNHHQITFTLVETWLIVLFFSLTLQVEFD